MTRWKLSLHCLICISLLVFNVDIISMSWNWFEAQQYCRKRNDTLEYNVSSNSKVDFWSGLYKRHSLWIKILGCYYLNAVQNYEEFHMHYLSAGFCQEMCTTVNSAIFGIQKNKCVCLKTPVMARAIPSNFCNESCNQDANDIQFSECGGSDAFTLYIADTSESPNLTSGEYNGKTACLAINCGTNKTFSISSGCSESYLGVCEDKGYLGCFKDQWPRTLKDGSVTSDKTTVTECKNICSEKKTKYYGVENSNECFCGNTITSRVEKPESECNMQCRGDVRQICGGSWRINIYRNPFYIIDKYAKQNWKESMNWCKTWSLPTYLYGNISLINASLACRALFRTRDGSSWLGIAKEVYIGYDTGVVLEAEHRRTFLQCQKCNHTGCAFVDCFNKLNYVLCQKTSLVETITVDYATNGISDLTIPEDPGNLMTIIAIIVSLLVFFIFVGCIVMVITIFIHKKKKGNGERKEDRENNIQKLNISENCYANVNGAHAMMENYSEHRLSSNDFSKEENPMQNLDEPYRESLDGVYDHLGDKETKQNRNDDYDHAHFAAESEDGVYNTSTSGISLNKSQEEVTYDHAGSFSDYGEHGRQVEKMEDTYSRLHITPQSGH